jgi:hypothetical protein
MAAKGAAKGTLNAKNLEALGAARLAELLIQLCEGNNASKRLLRLALAEQKGPLEMARELRKRLASIARAGSLLDDHQRDELVRELERQRQAICGPIAAHDADLAVDLLWEVLELSTELIERCDDRDAVLRDWFHQASAALGQVALAARGKPQNLADQLYAAVVSNSYGQFDPIVRDLGPALGNEGLAHLRLRLETLRQRSSGTDTAKSQPDLIVSIAMLDIADALGDAEAYLAEYRDHSPEALTVPAIAAKVATRLTKAGRAEQALTLLQAADPTPSRRRTGAEAWCDARLAALEALGRSDGAQAQRWDFALMELSSRHLRDYLKRLPAFEDMPAEEKALDLVAEHDDLEEALWFLLHWPEPHRAARLVLAAPNPLNGDRYYLLAPLAELLEKRQPLAATVCLRAMVDFTLKVKRPKRYPHAARHLETCHRLAAAINDWGELVDHRSYMLQLRRDHDRMRGFWSEVPKKIIPVAEARAKAMGKGVVEKGGKGRGLRGPGDGDGESGSVQPGLW